MLDKILALVEAEVSTFNQDSAYFAEPAQGLLQVYAQLKLAHSIECLLIVLERELPLLRGEIGRR